ncbi:MAG TPA: hypothetical protein VIP70_04810 [Nitrososphaeraceae archaeon]
MTKGTVLEFISKDCKHEEHPQCHGNWAGLGFLATCSCSCHRQQKQKVLAEVEGPDANTIWKDQSSKEITLND